MKTNLTHQSSFRSIRCRTGFAFLFLLIALTSQAAPFGTEFTYQGRLDGAAGPANGRYDFTFGLHLAASGGTPIVTVTNINVGVSNGLFTTAVDFGGGIFNGNAYWIQLGVRSNGTAVAFTPLSPRQPLTPTPNAHYATLAGTVPGGSITSAKLGVDSVTTSALLNNSVTGAKIANGQVVRNLNGLQDAVLLAAGANTTLATNGNTLTLAGSSDWKLDGNAGTTPATQYLGTSDNNPLTIKVNNATALRIEPALFGPNVIGGLAALRPTVVTAGVRGAVVAGGGAPAGPVSGGGGGDFFAVYDSDCAIGGGFGNKVGTDNGNVEDSPFATVAGGVFNWAAGYAATVAGGDGNYAAGTRAAIGGGVGNQTHSTVAVIAGGQANVVQTNSPSATISGGQNNSISPGGIGYVSAKGSTIGGGEGNTVFGLGGFPEVPLHNDYGTIGGGYSNTVNGSYGTIPGGYFNTASGDFSFAAGSRAAAGYGCFVWADASSTSPFSSTADNQFSIRAVGGVRLNTDTSLVFGSAGSSKLWPDQGGAIELGNSLSIGNTPYIDFHFGIGSDQDFSVRLINDAPGLLTCSGIFQATAFLQTSDRNAKQNFKTVDTRTVLEQVAALPITEWAFKQETGTRHIGPMAQDFYAAFGVGQDDRHIATVDADGVALAAIQGLNEKVDVGSRKSEASLHALEAENAGLKARLEKLEQLIRKLTKE